jgi:hypothetical protein
MQYDQSGFYLMSDEIPTMPLRGLFIGLAIEAGAVILVFGICWLFSILFLSL